jgi:hypothetical protein
VTEKLCSYGAAKAETSASLPFMPQFTTPSTFSVISSPAVRFTASGRTQWSNNRQQPQPRETLRQLAPNPLKVGRKEVAEVGVVDAPVHMDEADLVELLVAGEAPCDLAVLPDGGRHVDERGPGDVAASAPGVRRSTLRGVEFLASSSFRSVLFYKLSFEFYSSILIQQNTKAAPGFCQNTIRCWYYFNEYIWTCW